MNVKGGQLAEEALDDLGLRRIGLLDDMTPQWPEGSARKAIERRDLHASVCTPLVNG
jgi:hypothetical protein